MNVVLLPLRAVVFQLLVMIVAIAIEGFIFQIRFGYGRRACVEYATIINLVTIILGWLTFFYVELVLPLHLEEELISFIFFGQWTIDSLFWLTLMGILIFFGSLGIKIKTFELIEKIQHHKIENYMDHRTFRSSSEFYKQVKSFKSTGLKSFVILQAHSYSHVAVLIILTAHILKDRI